MVLSKRYLFFGLTCTLQYYDDIISGRIIFIVTKPLFPLDWENRLGQSWAPASLFVKCKYLNHLNSQHWNYELSSEKTTKWLICEEIKSYLIRNGGRKDHRTRSKKEHEFEKWTANLVKINLTYLLMNLYEPRGMITYMNSVEW